MTTPLPFEIPGAYFLTVNTTQAGQPAQNVLGFAVNDLTFPTVEQFVQLLDAYWGVFRTVTAADTSCTGGTVRQAKTEGVVWELSAPANPAGSSTAGTTSVAAYCAMVKWSTATGGRSGKGRTYLPGVPKDAIAVGGRSFTPTYASAVATAITNYRTHAQWATMDCHPAVLSRVDQAEYPITAGALAAIPGIQRRRMR
jgi:hypothetical protein